MPVARNWTCPHCSVVQTLTEPKISTHNVMFSLDEPRDGKMGLQITAFGCANPECGDTTVEAALRGVKVIAGSRSFFDKPLDTFKLRPRGSALPQPDYIPPAIRRDYLEASLIRDVSPNASASLARRCLQGMIRDFAGVEKDLLVKQIASLREAVDGGTAARGVTVESVIAIDHVREIGNIGAHMETPTGLIVDVEADEASALLDLIEALFRDWYVERDNRERRFGKISAIRDAKKAEIAASRIAQREDPSKGAGPANRT